MKRLLLLTIAAFFLLGFLSPSTNQRFVQHLGTFTGVSADENFLIEVPSWAWGCLVYVNVTNCVACNGNVHWWLPMPDASTITDWDGLYSTVVATFTTNGWKVGGVIPVDNDTAFDPAIMQGPLVQGTVVFNLNRLGGTFDADVWIRYLREPKAD